MARSLRILSTWLSMNFWPPKPGLTDMTRMRSIWSSTYSMVSIGVAGLRTTPASQPRSLIWLTTRCRWMVDDCSAWTLMMSAPALAKSGTRCSGSTIIRCTSRTLSVTGRRASTTRGPMVMFGTKRPSMTSTCTQSQPASSMALTSSPSFEKSADRIEGETMTSLLLLRATRGLPPLLAEHRRAVRRDGRDSLAAGARAAREVTDIVQDISI
mmetsp:Transcript_13146/g.31149  ORF Transcript_13146/g.31149 Transcript_13146/m.31149 type:complete len:212 (+) Transcript_13146:534-1169(+)